MSCKQGIFVQSALGLLLTVFLAACMQPTDPNAGIAYFANYASLVGPNFGTATDYFSYPRGVAVDAGGNVYVVDSGHNRIVMMSSTASTSWTSFPSGSTPTGDRLKAPEGIAVSGTDIWVADSGNARIIRLNTGNWQGATPTFDAYTVVTLNSGSAALVYPVGLAIHGTTLYLTDPGSAFPGNMPQVYSINLTTTNAGTLGGTGSGTKAFGTKGSASTAGQFSWPRGIAADASGVYVADEANYRIVKMSLDLTSTWQTLGTRGSGTGQFLSPQSIASDGTNIYIVDSANYWIVKMGNNLSGWTSFGVQTGVPSTSVYPNWVAWDAPGGGMVVSDDMMQQIAEFK